MPQKAGSSSPHENPWEGRTRAPVWGGIGALLGFVICVLLTPIQTFSFSEGDPPAWLNPLQPLLDWFVELHSDIAPSVVNLYYFYGRMFFIVYLLTLLAPVALKRAGKFPETKSGNTAYVLSAGGLALGGLADIGAYWGGSEDFNTLQGIGFLFEQIGALAAVAGATLFGVVGRRAGTLPKWASWLLYLTIPGAFAGAYLTTYVPHGLFWWISLAWAMVAIGAARPDPELPR